MRPNEYDNYYPVSLKNRNHEVKDNRNDALYIIIFFMILLIIFIIFIVFFFSSGNNENEIENNVNNISQNENIDEALQNIIETEDGYKIEEDFYTKIKDKKLVISNSGSRMYLISFENSDINEYEYIEISNVLYNNLEIGDDIKIMRTTYYNKSDIKLYYDDFLEDINVY